MAAAEESGFFDDWPKWSKPIFALSAMILLGGAWIGVPLLSALKLIDNNAQAGVVDYTPMITMFVAMTTATITGIFLFMTLRIDRGTRLKAERVAKDKVDEIVKSKFNELGKFEEASKKKLEDFESDSRRKLENFDDVSRGEITKFEEMYKVKFEKFETDAKGEFGKFERKLDESIRPEVIKEAIQDRIPEETFRAYVEAVLLANANGQIIREYARERAAAMDAKALEALLGLLNETIEHVARRAKEERDGLWARAMTTMTGWWRR